MSDYGMSKCPGCGRSLAGQVKYFDHGDLVCADCFFGGGSE